MRDMWKNLTQLNDFIPPTLALESKRKEISLDVIVIAKVIVLDLDCSIVGSCTQEKGFDTQ